MTVTIRTMFQGGGWEVIFQASWKDNQAYNAWSCILLRSSTPTMIQSSTIAKERVCISTAEHTEKLGFRKKNKTCGDVPRVWNWNLITALCYAFVVGNYQQAIATARAEHTAVVEIAKFLWKQEQLEEASEPRKLRGLWGYPQTTFGG